MFMGATTWQASLPVKRLTRSSPTSSPAPYVMNENETGQAGAAGKQQYYRRGVYPTAQPVIKGRFELYGGCPSTITQVVIDGKEKMLWRPDVQLQGMLQTNNFSPLVENTEIKNFVKGITYGNVVGTIESLLSASVLSMTSSVTVATSSISIKNYVKTLFTFEKSTIYNCAHTRDFIRYDDGSSSYSGAAPVITVDQCTLRDDMLNESNEVNVCSMYALPAMSSTGQTTSCLTRRQFIPTSRRPIPRLTRTTTTSVALTPASSQLVMLRPRFTGMVT